MAPGRGLCSQYELLNWFKPTPIPESTLFISCSHCPFPTFFVLPVSSLVYGLSLTQYIHFASYHYTSLSLLECCFLGLIYHWQIPFPSPLPQINLTDQHLLCGKLRIGREKKLHQGIWESVWLYTEQSQQCVLFFSRVTVLNLLQPHLLPDRDDRSQQMRAQ